ncbi:MAG: hypothetical protein QOD75_2473, partial [Blastocatellia bacterium]|nr:hypothetical protein [Blastocatellia bacterium]
RDLAIDRVRLLGHSSAGAYQANQGQREERQ